MSERERDTVFLRRLILFADTDEGRKVGEGIERVRRDARCVRRAVWLMVLLALLGGAGFGYGAILQENSFFQQPRLVSSLPFACTVASLCCLATFSCLLLAYRRKLNLLREHGRELVTKFLEARSGSQLGAAEAGVVPSAVAVNAPGGCLAPVRDGATALHSQKLWRNWPPRTQK